VALIEQGGDEPRTNIAGGAGDQDSHGRHRTEVPALTESKSTYRLAPCTNTGHSAIYAVRGLVPIRNW
jgi:hypothetical protein